MGIGGKIAIWSVSILGIAGISYFIYRRIQNAKPDVLTIDFGTIDWNGRKIPYSIKANGNPESSGIFMWRSDQVGKQEAEDSANAKNHIFTTNLTNGFIVRGESLGMQQFAKIIDFTSKTIKDYTGGNINNALAGASVTANNLLATMF